MAKTQKRRGRKQRRQVSDVSKREFQARLQSKIRATLLGRGAGSVKRKSISKDDRTPLDADELVIAKLLRGLVDLLSEMASEQAHYEAIADLLDMGAPLWYRLKDERHGGRREESDPIQTESEEPQSEEPSSLGGHRDDLHGQPEHWEDGTPVSEPREPWLQEETTSQGVFRKVILVED